MVKETIINSELIDLYEYIEEDKKEILCKLYKDWIITKGCIVTTTKPVDPHHVRQLSNNKGVGMKPPDIFCLPLSKEYHTGDNGIHVFGYETFQKKYKINLAKKLKFYHKEFMRIIKKENLKDV